MRLRPIGDSRRCWPRIWVLTQVPQLSALHERILRQERLNTQHSAKTTAADALAVARATSGRNLTIANLRDAAGRHYPLKGAITRIGRLPDNDIVLYDDDVSRHHAVIIDTGGSFVITDLTIGQRRDGPTSPIRPSVTLADGDHISICSHQFVFEIQRH